LPAALGDPGVLNGSAARDQPKCISPVIRLSETLPVVILRSSVAAKLAAADRLAG
jgi:hypothetical protein